MKTDFCYSRKTKVISIIFIAFSSFSLIVNMASILAIFLREVLGITAISGPVPNNIVLLVLLAIISAVLIVSSIGLLKRLPVFKYPFIFILSGMSIYYLLWGINSFFDLEILNLTTGRDSIMYAGMGLSGRVITALVYVPLFIGMNVSSIFVLTDKKTKQYNVERDDIYPENELNF